MRSYASIIKEIELANFLIDTFVIAPLNDELRYNKGENITHFAIGPHFFKSLFGGQSEPQTLTNLRRFFDPHFFVSPVFAQDSGTRKKAEDTSQLCHSHTIAHTRLNAWSTEKSILQLAPVANLWLEGLRKLYICFAGSTFAAVFVGRVVALIGAPRITECQIGEFR